MGGHHGACADGQNHQDSGKGRGIAHGLHQGSHHTGGGDHSHRGCAHCQLQDHGNDKGDQNADAGADQAAYGVSDGQQLQNGTEGAACAGDGQDAGAVQNALADPIQGVVLFAGGDQGHSQEHAQQQSHNRVTDEGDEGVHKAGAHGVAGEGSDGGQSNQDDGQQDGREAVQCAGELAVLFLQLIQGVLGVCGNVDLAGNGLCIDHSNRHSGDGDQQTHQNGQAQVSFQSTGHGDGAGGRRNQAVGGIQAAGQGGAHDSQRHIGLGSQCAADGRQDNEAGITEHRDTGDIAHGANGHNAVFLANQVQNGVCHGQGCAGLFQDGADDGTAQDHDADTRHDAAETTLDTVHHLGRGQLRFGINHAPDQAHQQGDYRHDNKGMHLPLGNGDDHHDNGQNDQREQKKCLHE